VTIVSNPPTMWCDYDEFEPQSYRGVVVDLKPGVQMRFFSAADQFLADLAQSTVWRTEFEMHVIVLESVRDYLDEMNACGHLREAIYFGTDPDPCDCQVRVSIETFNNARYTAAESRRYRAENTKNHDQSRIRLSTL
jgi:hypothetical protein